MIAKPIVPVEHKILQIMTRLNTNRYQTLEDFVSDSMSLPDMIAIFLGVLELIKIRKILIYDTEGTLLDMSAKFTINGGVINGEIRDYNKNTVVNGGTFVAYSQLTYAIICEGKTVINDANVAGKHGAVAGTSTTTTEIYGGSFELLDNPGVSDHCTYFVTAIYGGVFTLGNNNDNGGQVFYESTIATGYHAVENDGKFYVVAEGIDAVVTSQANLETALASGDAKIYLAAGEYTMPATGKFNAGDVVVCAPGTVFTGSSNANINGATIEGATFSNPGGSAVSSTINGTFKGCTFEGSNGARWAYAGETVVFEDCVFSGSTYGVHFDGGANDVIFRNCTLSGFNALGGELTMVTFEDCTFVGNGKSAYNGANLWGSAAFKNCEFTFDGTSTYEWIDCIGADKTYSFDNCTINGVAYSAENYASYIANIWSRNHKTVKINGVDCTL